MLLLQQCQRENSAGTYQGGLKKYSQYYTVVQLQASVKELKTKFEEKKKKSQEREKEQFHYLIESSSVKCLWVWHTFGVPEQGAEELD